MITIDDINKTEALNIHLIGLNASEGLKLSQVCYSYKKCDLFCESCMEEIVKK